MLTSDNFTTFPLARYTAKYWCLHFRSTKASDQAIKLVMQLLQGDAFQNWIRLCDPDSLWQGANMKRSVRDFAPLLYYASKEGLLRPVSLLIEKGADVNAQGGDYGDAL